MQRRDEVAGIRHSEIEDAPGVWTIRGERTKNGSIHDVPLSGPAQSILRALPRLAGSEFVLTTTGKRPVSGYARAKNRLDKVMLEIARADAIRRGEDPATVFLQPWRFHDLRRTAASGLARLGFPVHVIEAVLNHRSGQISGVAAIYNRYSYLAEKRRALNAWTEHIINLADHTQCETQKLQREDDVPA